MDMDASPDSGRDDDGVDDGRRTCAHVTLFLCVSVGSDVFVFMCV